MLTAPSAGDGRVGGAVPRISPDSLLWRHAGDWRIYLLVPATSLLQNMLPGVSAGIEQHSVAFADPFGRFARSIPQIMGTIYDPQMPGRVRDYHHHVKGVDAAGARYHALGPELFFAAHAVFTYSAMATIDTFDHQLSAAEKAALYEDCKTWYRRYGISDRAMPDTWTEFESYWEQLTTEVMRATSMAVFIADVLADPMRYRPTQMPAPVWRLLRPLLAHEGQLLARALLPPAAREHLGWRLSTGDRAQFAVQAAAVRRGWRLLPSALRESPSARGAKQRLAAAPG
jgi:uncharacterized protein (DUF2236 family)